MSPEEFEKQMLEKLEIQQKGFRDQYNSTDNPFEEADYEKVLNADLDYAPKKGETFESYYVRLLVYVKMGAKKNIKTHINGPKGAWYTHRNPQGCYSCEDMNLISCMCNVIGLMSNRYPEGHF